MRNIEEKLTAVQWLRSEFIKLEDSVYVYGVIYDLLDRAEEIEKDTIKEAHVSGFTDNLIPEEYYNRNYNNSMTQK
jgi:hypothetical protein